MSKTHKEIILADHVVVNKKDMERGSIVTLENNDANLLLAMNRAFLVDSDEGKKLVAAVKKEKADAKKADAEAKADAGNQ